MVYVVRGAVGGGDVPQYAMGIAVRVAAECRGPYHGRRAVVCHGKCRGISWQTTEYRGMPWVCHCMPWSTTNSRPWHAVLCHDTIMECHGMQRKKQILYIGGGWGAHKGDTAALLSCPTAVAKS